MRRLRTEVSFSQRFFPREPFPCERSEPATLFVFFPVLLLRNSCEAYLASFFEVVIFPSVPNRFPAHCLTEPSEPAVWINGEGTSRRILELTETKPHHRRLRDHFHLRSEEHTSELQSRTV